MQASSFGDTFWTEYLAPREVIPIWQRQAWVDASHMTPGRVTLDSEPAVICGFREPFAHVARIGERPKSVEFSWHSVRHVLEYGNGAFLS